MTAMWVVALAAALGFATPHATGERRLRAVHGSRAPAPSVIARRFFARRLAVAAAGAGATLVLVGSPWGAVVGLAVALAADRLLARSGTRAERRRREQPSRDLPILADLIAACLRAGATLAQATAAVAVAVDDPLATELRRVAARMRLGEEPERAWHDIHPSLAPLARAIARTADSGAPLADTLARLARRRRQAARTAAMAAARRVGVWATAPLGLCFLPAFVLLGVIPVVAGLLVSALSP